MKNTIDVIVIGAGHAGLSTSYYLKRQNIPHIVLEKGTIGASWKNLRWDSFCMNTPNWMNCLPGNEDPLQSAKNFFSKDEYVNYLMAYAQKNALPIQENTRVTALDKDANTNLFRVSIESNDKKRTLFCKSVVIASGILNVPKTPKYRSNISEHILQLHASEYRNPSKLPKGAVLVVGGGQSGAQITEDLLKSGRKVFLSTSKVGRVPRRYRGKDFTEWFEIIEHFSDKRSSLEDPSVIHSTNPLMSGVGPLGHTISLQHLHKFGAVLLGRLKEAKKNQIIFDDQAQDHINFADNYSNAVKTFIDEIIANNNLEAEAPGLDSADMECANLNIASKIKALNLDSNDISTIIWSTGFTGNFSWLKLPVLDKNQMPIHDEGNSTIPGLYFFGFPWIRSRKSGIVYGMSEEAELTVGKVMKQLNQEVTESLQYS